MNIEKITNPRSVIASIELCNSLGEDKFLKIYGYEKNAEYLLFFEGKYYQSKAILGVAYNVEFSPNHITTKDFLGGEVVVKKLNELGFKVIKIIKNSNIEDAIDYVVSQVMNPILINHNVSKETRDSVRNTKIWIERFRKIGDLYKYLIRFKENNLEGYAYSEIYEELKKHKLMALEDLVPLFELKFMDYLNDLTTIKDFIVGEEYTAFDIAIFSEMYNNQRGIHLIEEDEKIKAIFIKVSFDFDSDYKNSWITEKNTLKYYLYSHNSKFDENYKQNKAIINSANIPLYVFLKTNDNEYVLDGAYEFIDVVTELDKSKWFRLQKNKHEYHSLPIGKKTLNLDFEKEIEESERLSSEQRLELINSNIGKPSKREVVSSAFIRCPHIVVETKKRANGVCEKCNKVAPFVGKNNEPYLEVHHLIYLSQDGIDELSNTLALCPNCHREMHSGIVDDNEFLRLKNKIMRFKG